MEWKMLIGTVNDTTDVRSSAGHVAEKAEAEIRRLWIRPLSQPKRFAVAPEHVAPVSRRTLDAMLVRDFRITPLPPPDEYDQLLSRVTHWVRRGRPIRIMLGY